MTIEKTNFDVRNGISEKGDKVNKENQNAVEFDDLLSFAGHGRYQILLFIATFPFYYFGVFSYFTQVFLTEVSSNHWCWIPELENLTDIERRNLAIPADDSRFGYSRCKAYVANWTDVLQTGRRPDETWNVTTCQHGWEFNKTEIPYPTIASEMGWVCDRDNYQATAQSIFFIGSIIGGVLIGWISDRFGRLPAIIVSNLFCCLGGVASAFAKNFLEFTISRFVVGIGYDNVMMMMYLLVLEYVAPKYRTRMANASFAIFYSSGVTALPWIALACGHWKTLALVTSIPMALVVFAPLCIPESPRWMLSRGRIDAAVNKIISIGQINKTELPPKLIEQFKTSALEKREESSNILELLRRPILRKTFLLLCLDYICCTLVFDSLVRSIRTLNYDFFISFSVISATELPSVLLLAFIMDYMGRRWLVATTFTFSGVFTLLHIFVPNGLTTVILAMIARFAANMTYCSVQQWAAELFPTSVRGVAVSIAHIFAFFGLFLSPAVIYLGNFIYWLPFVIITCVAALGSIVALSLPETAKRVLPQTFEDAEILSKGMKFFYVPFLNRRVKNKDVSGNCNESFES